MNTPILPGFERSSALNRRSPIVALSLALSIALACTPLAAHSFNQSSLPAAVQVPAGHSVAFETPASGTIDYACTANSPAAGQFNWVFVGPKANINSRSGALAGFYFGPPATWQHIDGSSATGMQLAISPNGADNIPLQLVKANSKPNPGVFAQLSHIQRVATIGGTAPKLPCAAGNVGEKQTVNYSADYIYWKTN